MTDTYSINTNKNHYIMQTRGNLVQNMQSLEIINIQMHVA